MLIIVLLVFPVIISNGQTLANQDFKDTFNDLRATDASSSKRLYNGIVLPEVWPPNDVDPLSDESDNIPYLRYPAEGGYKPDIIDITIGRQLFVDDFLIANTDLTTVYHKPVQYDGNPVLKPETYYELSATQPGAGPKSGGVWYDMDEGIYKMWYEAGWNHRLAYATSTDGINWDKSNVPNGKGSNIVLWDKQTDSTTVWIDYDTTDPSQKYKMLVRSPNPDTTATLYVSGNGIDWTAVKETSNVDDRTTFFYNWFRKQWVFSIRRNANINYHGLLLRQRVRYYRESPDFIEGGVWNDKEAVFWLKTDAKDPINVTHRQVPQLYNFDAIAYESIMVGMFQIWQGPHNDVASATKTPKTTELIAAYSRDGFYFHRPDRSVFIEATEEKGDWNRGYVQSVGGGIIIQKDELWIYHIGFSGSYNGRTGMHTGFSTGFSILRRDGFASLNGTGKVTTNTLTTKGDKKYLFVNAKVPDGSIAAQILDASGKVVEGYSFDDCKTFTGDQTQIMITWKNASDLSFLNNSQFKIEFKLVNGEFYSFWLSDDINGNSDGATAAGLVQQ
ncbi:MAG: glycosyl hydrolase family 32 [Clostridiales bacterium]|nr:glycosyl hydrolase family 32 [Clostridiales bacterium]